MARVLRPGGRLVILEITQPQTAAALDLLLALVRPDRPSARPGRGRPRGLLVSARVGAQLPTARGARRDHGPCRTRAHPLHDPCRRHHRDPLRRPRRLSHTPGEGCIWMNRSAVPPPVTQVMDAAQSWLPALMARVEAQAGRAGRGARRDARGRRPRHARSRRQAPAARCWCCSAPGPAPAKPRCVRRPRSSWSTWRRWSTTTCSMRPLSGAGCRRSSRPPAATRATSVGDLLLSRAFAELGRGEDRRRRAAGQAPGARLGRARAGRAGAAPRRLRPAGSAPIATSAAAC